MLVIGYRKTQRNVLPGAAILLFLAGALGPMTQGFIAGWRSAAG